MENYNEEDIEMIWYRTIRVPVSRVTLAHDIYQGFINCGIGEEKDYRYHGREIRINIDEKTNLPTGFTFWPRNSKPFTKKRQEILEEYLKSIDVFRGDMRIERDRNSWISVSFHDQTSVEHFVRLMKLHGLEGDPNVKSYLNEWCIS